MIKAPWISVETQLPPEGKYVLLHVIGLPWNDDEDRDGVFHVVGKIRMGISRETRRQMREGEITSPDVRWGDSARPRHLITENGDEGGNNLRPYCWKTFGAMSFFGQEVDCWMPIPQMS